MSQHIAFSTVAPEPYRILIGLEEYLRKSTLGHGLLHLVKMRASQLNGCAYCIDMHSKDARAAGETEQRLYGVSAFRECPWYDEREKAALEWTEEVTRLDGAPTSESVRAEVLRHFTEKELVDLTWAIGTINVWNRLCVSLGAEVGSYRPMKASHS